jgi:hypothetical protein
VEKLVFAAIVLLAILFVFSQIDLPIPSAVYLIAMNLLIGLKVACGFLIVFYRFVVLERR